MFEPHRAVNRIDTCLALRHVDRVTVKPGQIEIAIRPVSLGHLMKTGIGAIAASASTTTNEPTKILTVTARLKRTGIEKKLLVSDGTGESPAKTATNLQHLLVRAHEFHQAFFNHQKPIGELAKDAGVSASYYTRVLRLSFLAPDITRTILRGRQLAALTASKLMRDTRLPLNWHDQRSKFLLE